MKPTYLITLLVLLTLMSLASVSAVTMSPLVTISSGGESYTVNSNVTIAYLDVRTDSLYIDGITYCNSEYQDFFDTTKSCTLQDIEEEADNMNTIIFAAFGLIALFVVISAGFIIVKMFSGGADAGMLMALAIASIILIVVLLAGFYILGTLAGAIS